MLEGDLTPAESKVDYFPFAKVLYEERNGLRGFGAALFVEFELCHKSSNFWKTTVSLSRSPSTSC